MIRWAQVTGAAILVSVGSALMFPQTFIYFGVLHHMAFAMLICRLSHRLGRWNVLVGGVIIASGLVYQWSLFDQSWLNWVGFMTHKPATQDYVPVFPWMGVMLMGSGLAEAWFGRSEHRKAPLPRISTQSVPVLQYLGRHSLVVYLVHQPLLIGLLWLFQRSWSAE